MRWDEKESAQIRSLLKTRKKQRTDIPQEARFPIPRHSGHLVKSPEEARNGNRAFDRKALDRESERTQDAPVDPEDTR